MIRIVGLLFLMLVLLMCTREKAPPYSAYQTQNVVILLIDGPRYSETWGDPSHSNIPVRDSLSQFGVLLTNFRNQGETFTIPGHTAICTGFYQSVANDGSQLPARPSIFQYWLKNTGDPYTKCCIIGSKDKLHVLSNCVDPEFHNLYRPFFDCGVNGDGTGGYRSDSITLNRALDALTNKQPRLMLVAFKDPDYYGHLSDSVNYINAIRKTDQYVGVIWNFIQNDPHYKDKTTLIVTNDHGRHLNGVQNGFTSHGDDCEGCRHIELFALSPDFKKNVQINTPYEQLDISATIRELMHFPFYTGNGKVMKNIFL